MKHTLLLIASFLFLNTIAFGQSKFDTSDHKGGKWEVGVDLYSAFFTGKKLRSLSHEELLDPNRTLIDLPILQNSIIVKRKLSNRTKLRTRLGFTYEEQENRPNRAPETNFLSGGPLGGYLSTGMERYFHKGRVSAFFGGEVFGYFFRHVQRVDSKNVIGPGYTSRTVRDYYSDQQYGMNSLLGIDVRIVNHLFLSAEVSLRLAYRQQYTDRVEHWDGIVYSSGGVTLKRFIVSAEPISAVNLIYHF